MKHERVSTTQLAATPVLYGDDAKRLLESLKSKTTTRSRKNSKKLAQFFKGIEKSRLKQMTKDDWKEANEVTESSWVFYFT
ncbi:hypothetical protein D3C74_51430 [compost metagenome]